MNAREDLVGNVSAVGSQIAVKFLRPVDSHLRQLVSASGLAKIVGIVAIDKAPISILNNDTGSTGSLIAIRILKI